MGMVKFIECTFDEWNSLQKDPDTLYFVSDKNTVYKGETPYAGTDTTYSAGDGLSLIGTEFSIADGGITTTKVADGAVTDAKIAGMSADKLVGTIPSSNLPSYVDDVVEYTSLQEFPETGESGKIYVDTTANTTYRWSGTDYVAIGSSLALGETSATAFRGDYGKVAYDHAQAKGSAFTNGLYKITTNAEGHVTEATAVVKEDITALGISEDIPHATDTVYGTVKFASDEDFNAFMGI